MPACGCSHGRPAVGPLPRSELMGHHHLVDMPVRLVEILVRPRPSSATGQRHAGACRRRAVDGADRRRRARNPEAVRAIQVRFPSVGAGRTQDHRCQGRLCVGQNRCCAAAAPARALAGRGGSEPSATAGPQAWPAESAAPEPGLLPVTAPMVGKFYAAPSPSDPPFVTPGSQSGGRRHRRAHRGDEGVRQHQDRNRRRDRAHPGVERPVRRIRPDPVLAQARPDAHST